MARGTLIPKDFWNFPTISFPSLLEEVEDLFPTTVWPSTNLLNGLSISEDSKNVYVEAAVPGVNPKEIDVTFEKGILTIRAEKKEEEKEKTFHRKATKSFFYRVTPGDVDSSAEPEAICNNGVMTVTFAKSAQAKPKRITVKAA